MYLGKKTLHFLSMITVVSVVLFIVFLVGPELFPESTVSEFMMNYRGLLIYHCIIFTIITVLFRKFHAEVSVEFKSLQDRMRELENK